MSRNNCKKCGITILEFVRDYKIDDYLYCRNCYYEEFGKFIEKNPIESPYATAPRKSRVQGEK